MLHFSNKPDAFFHIFFHDAVNEMLAHSLVDDEDELAAGGQCYSAEAKAQLHALTTAFTDPGLYQLTEYHWFLLYEALYMYSYVCNERPLETALYQEHGIEVVNFDDVADLYCADTDFLGHPTGGLTVAQRRMLADPMERWALGVGVKPPQADKLTLTMCPDEWRHDFETAEAIDYIAPWNVEYPALPETPSSSHH